MPKLRNYIVDSNPFALAGPPDWFLARLYQYDPSLVIVPSRQGHFYRLCQRRPLRLPERVINDILKEESDTKMLASHSLVPVTTILATVWWDNPTIFEELTKRAPWRMGGAKKFTDLVEAQDQKREMDNKLRTDEHLDYLAKDSWKFYNKLIGTRSHLWSPTVKSDKPASETKAPSLIISGAPAYKPAVQATWAPPRARR